jgi:hypothetical protein
MKKVVFICLLFSGITGKLTAQSFEVETLKNTKDPVKQNRLELLIGRATPLGDFSSSDIANPYAAYAKSGFNFGLKVAFGLTENLEFTVAYNFAGYPVNEEAFSRDLTIVTEYLTSEEVTTQSVISNFQHHSITTGLLVKFSQNPQFYINPQLGYSNFATPDYQNSYQFRDTALLIEQTLPGHSAEKIIFSVDVGLRTPLTSTIDFVLNVQYIGTEYEIELTSYSRANGGPTLYSTSVYDQPFSSLNLRGGICLKL